MKKFFLLGVIALTVSGAALNAQTWQIGTPTATDVTAVLSGSTLTINGTGTGTMLDFASDTDVPWYSVRNSITVLVIQSGVTHIGNNAFYFCQNITGALTFPNSVTSIGNNAFYICSQLTSVTIPNSVTSIGSMAFRYCRALTSIDVAAGNPNYSSVNGVLFNNSQTLLVLYPNGKTGTYTIPNTVNSIGDWAFDNCYGLTSITIPSSVTSIGNDAFFYCSGLTSITCLNSDPTAITMGSNVFLNVPTTTCVLRVPTGSKTLYQNAPQWSAFTNIVEGATGIDDVQADNLKIYVANGELIIVGDVPFDNLPFTILDLAGKQIVNGQWLNGKSINVSALPQGVYFIKIQTDSGVVTTKFVKE